MELINRSARAPLTRLAASWLGTLFAMRGEGRPERSERSGVRGPA
jgi:hypothetical protein